MKTDDRMDKWHDRSPIERRSDMDSRRKNSVKYFKDGGRERRSGKERRHTDERRDKWMRVGTWGSMPVFDE